MDKSKSKSRDNESLDKKRINAESLYRQNTENIPVRELEVRKSNSMVSGKFNASLLENQLLMLSLARIEQVYDDTNEVSLSAKLYPWELKNLVSDEGHISRDLFNAAGRLTGRGMFIEDGRGNWKAFSMIPNAEYKNGELTIEFNKELKEHIFGLDQRGFFTTAQLPIMLNIKTAAAFRIYELLNKELYRCKKNVNNGMIDVEFNISEFRFMIGMANNENPKVKERFGKKKVDWDELYNLLDKDEKKYEKWGDLSRYVIKPAMEELNEVSDIWFDYEMKKVRNRASSVVFHVKRKEPAKKIAEKKKILEENNKVRYAELFEELTGHNGLTEKDIQLLLEKSNNNVALIRETVRLADQQSEIRNYMGWLIRCIEKGGYETVGTVNGDAEQYEVISQIREDYEESLRSGNIQAAVWEKNKARRDFSKFASYIGEFGYTIQDIERSMTKEECCELFTCWLVKRPVDAFIEKLESNNSPKSIIDVGETQVNIVSDEVIPEEKQSSRAKKVSNSTKKQKSKQSQIDQIVSGLSEEDLKYLINVLLTKPKNAT